jgi:hypothetical protein
VTQQSFTYEMQRDAGTLLTVAGPGKLQDGSITQIIELENFANNNQFIKNYAWQVKERDKREERKKKDSFSKTLSGALPLLIFPHCSIFCSFTDVPSA